MSVTPLRARRVRVPRVRVPDGLLTLEEAAARLQIAPGTLKHWALRKRIEYAKVGKFMRFTMAALDRYIASQTVSAVEEG